MSHDINSICCIHWLMIGIVCAVKTIAFSDYTPGFCSCGAFCHRTELCALFKKRMNDPLAPYDGYDESEHSGVYELCKHDYPDILEELEKEPFTDILAAGCGSAPIISLLSEKYPKRHYTGLNLTPAL